MAKAKTVVLLNKLALAHMLAEGGEISVRALKGSEAVKEWLADKRLEAFVMIDPVLLQACGAQSADQFGQWFAMAIRDMTGKTVEPFAGDPPLLDDAERLYCEMEPLISSTIVTASNQPQMRLVAHWFVVSAKAAVPASPVVGSAA